MVPPLAHHYESPEANQTTPTMDPATTPSSMAQTSMTTTPNSPPNSTTTASTIVAPQTMTEGVASSAEGAQAQPADSWATIGQEASEARKEKGIGKKSRTKKTAEKMRRISYHLREIVSLAAAHRMDFNQLIDPLIKSEPDDSYDAESSESAMETEASEAGHDSQDEGLIGSFCQIHVWLDN